MRIYVAGPMRGIPHFNFPAFDAAETYLTQLGHQVFNPASHDRETYGEDLAAAATTGDEQEAADSHGFDLRAALGADLRYITQSADAVAVLDGWERSKGARAEVATALALGLLVLPARLFLSSTADGIAYAQAITELPTPTQPTLGEVRTVSSTGGEKGVKPARFDLLPAGPLWIVAEHYGRGAEKYEDRNWERGYEWSKSFGALMRHAWAFWGGEDVDQETGSPHMAAVTFHALALLEFERTHREFDNRPSTVTDQLVNG